MNRLSSLLLAFILSLSYAAVARDFTYTYEGQTIKYYVIDEVARTCETAYENTNSGVLVIPETVVDESGEQFSVIRIGDVSFYNCEITSATLPATVTVIGDNAFYNCRNLTKIEIPASITEIGGMAFSGCNLLTEVYVNAETPPVVGDDAFARFVNLYVPEQSIEKYRAQEPWSKFKVMPNSIKYEIIEGTDNARLVKYQSTAAEYTIQSNITIENKFCKVVEIADSAFYNNTSIALVVIPASISKIGTGAFAGCDNLSTIRMLGSTPPELGTDVFSKYEGVDIYVPTGSAEQYKATEGWNKFNIVEWSSRAFKYDIVFDLELGHDVARVVGYLPNLNFDSASIPSTVTIDEKQYTVVEIADSAFFNCTSLHSLTLPITVTRIGNHAFEGCKYLTSCSVNAYTPFSSHWEIGDYAFAGCESLSSLSSSDWVEITSLGRGAFSNCYKLTSFGPALSDIMTSIADDVFNGCVSLRTIKLPRTIETIGSKSFYGCEALVNLSLPSTLREIGTEAFNGCNLSSIRCDAVQPPVAGENAFSVSGDVVNLIVPAQSIELYASTEPWSGFRVTPTQADAFDYIIITDENLGKEVAVLSSVRSDIASECVIPSEVTIDGQTYPVVAIGYDAFAYRMNIVSVEIPETITSIGNSAFEGCTALTSIKLPEQLTTIGFRAFFECRKLESIVIPDSVSVISGETFCFCESLVSVKLPEALKSIELTAFRACVALKDVVLPAKLEYIGDFVFRDCISLTEITVPESVTTMGGWVFQRCTALTTVNLPATLTSLEIYAFEGCTSLSEIAIPDSLKSIGVSAFYNDNNLRKVYVNNLDHWSSIEFANEAANPLYYGAELIIDGQSLEVLEVPEDITEVKDYAFAGLKDIVEVIIPESVETIGTGSFIGCEGLESIDIPATVKSVGEMAFKACTKLASAIMGHIIRPSRSTEGDEEFESATIGAMAFESCSALTVVEIGTNISEIAENAFSECEAIEKVNSYSMTAPFIAETAFDPYTKTNAELHVPMGCAHEYETAAGWSGFATIIDDLPVDPALAVNLNITAVTIEEDDTVQLSAALASGEDAVFTWSSDDESVATVNNTGLVKAISEGTANITVTAPTGVRATCVVTVTSKHSGLDGLGIDGVKVIGNSIIVPVGAEIFDLSGRHIENSILLPSGIYIVRLASGESIKVNVK